jgi:hypothetical protein
MWHMNRAREKVREVHAKKKQRAVASERLSLVVTWVKVERRKMWHVDLIKMKSIRSIRSWCKFDFFRVGENAINICVIFIILGSVDP